MITTANRRNEERGRIPFEFAVELAHDDFDDSFEADAVDLSAGGLSLRTACLPDVGEELVCRFEAMPGGTLVSGKGRVVWTQLEGERCGEFGLRFTDIDAEDRALIDELVAERKAQVETAYEDRSPKHAELELAGVAAPLSARLLRSGGGEAVFEQSLDLLELGRSVVARAGGAFGRGSIAEVALHMNGGTPTLAVTVRFDEGRSLFGEFEWESKQEKASDTVPDLDAPQSTAIPSLRASEQARAQAVAARTTMLEFPAVKLAPALAASEAQASSVACEALPAVLTVDEVEPIGALQADQAFGHDADQTDDSRDADDTGDTDSEDDEVDSQDDLDDADSANAMFTPASTAPRVIMTPPRRTARAAVVPPAVTSAASEDPRDTWAHPVPESARSSVLVRLLRILVAIQAAARACTAFALKRLAPMTIAHSSRLRALIATRTLPFARYQAHALLAKFSARPRRTTTAPADMRPAENVERATARTALTAGLAVSAIALGVYALVPSPEEGAIPLHRPVRGHHAQTTHTELAATPAAGAAPALPAAMETVPAQPAASDLPQAKVNAAYASAMAGQPFVVPATTAAPRATAVVARTAPAPAISATRSVPTGSPYAVDVRDTARSASTKAPGPIASFGQRNVANARRFVLRMSAPVKMLQGTGDKSGFTVIATGAVSLDKAGPIAASHQAVARAMVLNKNGQAELTVRFLDGKSPAYRVTAHDAELEILIAQQ